jgi:hypothetical protein
MIFHYINSKFGFHLGFNLNEFATTVPSLNEWGVKVNDNKEIFSEWDEENSGFLSY